jgi:hypothetical protein
LIRLGKLDFTRKFVEREQSGSRVGATRGSPHQAMFAKAQRVN